MVPPRHEEREVARDDHAVVRVADLPVAVADGPGDALEDELAALAAHLEGGEMTRVNKGAKNDVHKLGGWTRVS